MLHIVSNLLRDQDSKFTTSVHLVAIFQNSWQGLRVLVAEHYLTHFI